MEQVNYRQVLAEREVLSTSNLSDLSLFKDKENELNRITVEKLIRDTDSLTYLNALKSAISELKEELTLIEETSEYQNLSIDRAKKIMRRIDNQYRAIIKSTAKLYNPPGVALTPGLGLVGIEKELEDE